MTSMPKILCTVRALHPFHSPEQSSLSFDKGDFIDVLAQLESGWWDGWYVLSLYDILFLYKNMYFK